MNSLIKTVKSVFKDRLRDESLIEKIVTADDAAKLVKDGMIVGTSGFTPAGYPKIVPKALAKRAHNGEKIGITLITGASVGDELDGELTNAGIIKKRYPYQTNSEIRDAINNGTVEYADMHLSHVPLWIKNGNFGKIDLAIIEAVAIDEDGNIIPSTSVGCSNNIVEYADKVIVELNIAQPLALEGIHDIYSPKKAPETEPIPIVRANNKIGMPYIKCDKEKIAAIVISDMIDTGKDITPIDQISKQMANNLISLLNKEIKEGRMTHNLRPIQSGVGNVANAVLSGLLDSDFSNLTLYSEVLQDAVLDLIDSYKIKFASATALTLSPSKLRYFYENIYKYKDKIILRPQEISNNPEVIRRLGIIAINTAIEVDMYGNVNSTHINGSRMMNGIGGSGDFARNSSLTIFTTASTAKNETVSSIVPFVTHVDHTEHDVHIIITEQGVADLRGLSPKEKAVTIIENCAHPKFKNQLRKYYEDSLNNCGYKHTPHQMKKAFEPMIVCSDNQLTNNKSANKRN